MKFNKKDNEEFCLGCLKHYDRGFILGWVAGLVTSGFIMLFILMALQ